MILRKPYAFLIRYFKIIHIFMFLIVGYLAFRLKDIYEFFQGYVKTSHFTYIPDMASNYINNIMIVLIVVVLIGTVLIYILMKKKDKPVLFYQILFGYLLVLLIMIFVYHNFFLSLEYKTYDSVTIVVYRDIVGFLYYINYFYLGFTFVRGFGFDIKKFSFEKDLKELNIKKSDNEEYELTLNVDKDDVLNSLRREKREFGYYLRENKVILLTLGIVLIIGLIGYWYFDFKVVNKVYEMNRWIDSNNLSFKINKAYLTNKNKYNEIISENNSFLIIELSILNRDEVSKVFDNANIRVMSNEKYFYPNTLNYSLFDDLGTGYNGQKIEYNQEKRYLLIYKINDVDDSFYLEFLEEQDKENKKRVLLELTSEEDSVQNFELQQEITLFNQKLVIDKYDFDSRFSYTYQECDSEGCNYYNKNIVPRLNNNVLALNTNLVNDDLVTYLENYLSIEYEIDGKSKIMSSRDVLVIGIYNNVLYLDVYSDIKNSDVIKLIINVRGEKYNIKVK